MMQVEEIVDIEQFAALKLKWKQLVSHSSRATPFQTWEWNFCSWKHFSKGQLWILIAKQEGEIVGILPLAISKGRRTLIRRVHWIGQMADYQDLIALPDKYEECTQAFFDYLCKERGRWDFCELTNVRESASVVNVEPTPEIRRVIRPHYKCPVMTLKGSFQEYLNQFSERKKKRILSYKERVQKELNGEFSTVEAVEELVPAMHELYELHSIQWKQKGETGKFINSTICAFHLDVARHFFEMGILKLHQMKTAGKTRAALYGFHFHDKFYGYLKGYDPTLGKYSLGMTMISHSISTAIEEGAHHFDFLSGDESYKYFWKVSDQQTKRLTFSHDTWRSKFAKVLHGWPLKGVISR